MRPTSEAVVRALMAQGAPPAGALQNQGPVIGPQWFHFNCPFPDNAVTPTDLRLLANITDAALINSLGVGGNNPELSMIIDAAFYSVQMSAETEAIQAAVRASAALVYDPGRGGAEVRLQLGPYFESALRYDELDAQAAPAERVGLTGPFGTGFGRNFQPFAVDFQQGLFNMTPFALVNTAGGNLVGDLWLHGYAWAGRAGSFLGGCDPKDSKEANRMRQLGTSATALAKL